MFFCRCIYVYVYSYICLYVYMYISIYMYVCTHRFSMCATRVVFLRASIQHTFRLALSRDTHSMIAHTTGVRFRFPDLWFVFLRVESNFGDILGNSTMRGCAWNSLAILTRYYTHAHTHNFSRTHAHAHAQTQREREIHHAYVHNCMHTHIHTYTHRYIDR